MTTPYRGSTSPYSRQMLRARQHLRISRDLFVPRPADGDVPNCLSDLTLDQRVLAARELFPDAVLCGITAGLWLNLPVDDDGQVHLMRQLGAWHSERSGITVHRGTLRDDEVFTSRGVRVTEGPRILADLASGMDLEGLVALGDPVLRRYGLREVHAAIVAGRPGVRLLREAVPLLDGKADSPPESRARLRLHAAGFTSLRHGVEITDQAGQWLATADLGDDVAKVALQHEGLIHFAKGEAQRQADAHRDALSRLNGWKVVTSTSRDDKDQELLIEKVTHAYLEAALLRGPQVLPPHLQGRSLSL